MDADTLIEKLRHEHATASEEVTSRLTVDGQAEAFMRSLWIARRRQIETMFDWLPDGSGFSDFSDFSATLAHQLRLSEQAMRNVVHADHAAAALGQWQALSDVEKIIEAAEKAEQR